jgi:hypothetical protein
LQVRIGLLTADRGEHPCLDRTGPWRTPDMKKHALLIAGGLSLILSLTASIAIARPIYPNSMVSNDLEFIKTSDESAFACIKI